MSSKKYMYCSSKLCNETNGRNFVEPKIRPSCAVCLSEYIITNSEPKSWDDYFNKAIMSDCMVCGVERKTEYTFRCGREVPKRNDGTVVCNEVSHPFIYMRHYPFGSVMNEYGNLGNQICQLLCGGEYEDFVQYDCPESENSCIFCVECWLQWLNHQDSLGMKGFNLNDEMEFGCPFENHSGTIKDRTMFKLLSENYENFKEKLNNQLIQNSPNGYTCPSPSPNCKDSFFVDYNGHDIYCLGCKYYFCGQCQNRLIYCSCQSFTCKNCGNISEYPNCDYCHVENIEKVPIYDNFLEGLEPYGHQCFIFLKNRPIGVSFHYKNKANDIIAATIAHLKANIQVVLMIDMTQHKLIIAGKAPGDEDELKSLKIHKNTSFQLVKNVSRQPDWYDPPQRPKVKASNENSTSKKCPGCKIYIDLDGGCRYVKCENCSTSFCGTCLKIWESKHVCQSSSE